MTRGAKLGVRIVLGVTAFLALLAVAAVVFVGSDTGERYVLDRVIPGDLHGSVEVGGFGIGFGTFALADVVVRGAEGEVIARAPRVTGTWSLAALVKGEGPLQSVRAFSPVLHLSRGPEGRLNLVRALRSARPKEAPGGPLTLRRVVLEDGTLFYEGEGGRIVVHHFDARGTVYRRPAKQKLGIAVATRGEVAHPQEGPLRLEGWLTRWGERTMSEAAARVADSEADVALRRGPEETRVRVDRLRIEPPLLRVFAPEMETAQPLRAEGEVRVTAGAVEAEAAVRAGDGELVVDGRIDLVERRTPGLRAVGRSVNLAAIVPGAPRSDLDFRLTAVGGGRDLEALQGRLELELERSMLKDETVGPVRVRARAESGRVAVSALHAELPGLTVDGGGGGEEVLVQAQAKVRSLSEAARFLRGLGLERVPDVEGAGTLALALTGALPHPSLSVDGSLSEAAWGERSARGVEVSARLPDVRRYTHLTADLSARRLVLGETRLAGPAVHLETRGEAFEARVSVEGPQQARLELSGTVGEARRSATFSQVVLAYPAATWRSTGVTEVAWGDDGFAVRDLELVSEGARLAATFVTRPLDARLMLEGVRLQDLPELVRPERRRLAGRVDGTVRLAGSLEQPTGTVRVRLDDPRLGAARARQAFATVVLDADAVNGQVLVRGLGGRLQGRFSLPARWPLPEPLPLDVDADARGLDVTQVLELARLATPGALERVASASGVLSGRARIRGRTDDPQVSGAVRVEGGSVRLRELDRYRDVTLAARFGPRRIVLETLTAAAGRGSVQASGRALRPRVGVPFDVELTATARRFPLPADEPLVASFEVAVGGTASFTALDLKVTVQDLQLWGREPEAKPPEVAGR